ncbi:MAG TPA: YkgJ family cysteine cluster protein [Phototrophicaceae bacterium]|nr:YkgJ family cysteine cluster protein [Phototrophicaceae bacterium]
MNPVITNLDEVRRLAAERRADFDALRAALEFDGTLTDEALDELVERIAAPIIAAIDCKQCANCCRVLDVCLVPPDIDRLSTALNISIDEVVDRYADEELGAVQGEWAVIPVKPCPMLRGNLCSIYAHRPHACRIYPQFTPDFRYNMEDTIEGASYCPIIYNVLSELAARVDSLPPDGE